MAVSTATEMGPSMLARQMGVARRTRRRQMSTATATGGNENTSRRSRTINRYSAVVLANSQDTTVAHAAPEIPIAGTGPKPKMKIGSSTTFTRPAIIMSRLGQVVSPVARIAELHSKGRASKTLNRNHTSRY